MAEVYNSDIAGLVRLGRRFKYETVKSVSANLAFVSEADFGRSKSYLKSLRSFKAWAVKEKPLDLPELAPQKVDLGEAEALPMPENESLITFAGLYDAFEIMIVNSQSARLANGMISHDGIRFDALINRMESFLDEYVAEILPLDVPESSPKREVTGEGRKGV